MAELHTSAFLLPGKDSPPPYPTYPLDRSLVAARNQTPIPLLLGLQHSHYTDCAAPVSIKPKNEVKI